MPEHPADSPLLATDLAGLALRNPVILAAGTAGYIDELAGPVDLARVGAVVSKSITAESRLGNPTWRVIESPVGMLNAIGLANVGVERFVSEFVPRAATAPTTIICSIAGHTIEGYIAVAERIETAPEIPAVEINVSCPNVVGGSDFGDSADQLRSLLRALRPTLLTTKMLVKLPPATTNAPGRSIVDLSRSAIDCGADAICIANTTPAMAIDVETRRPRLANGAGGLSGPAVHPIIVRLIHLAWTGAARETNVPIVGIGGVSSWRDAAEFILAGATAVEIGTALFADPRAPGRIVKGLERWVRRQGAANIADLVGAADMERRKT